jgi:osmoprotectant transport system ATP-binding protein
MIELRNVAKSFHGTQVLQPTSLTLKAGETTVLLGPSGCGKSTLLRIMVGLLAADQGEVVIQGEQVTPQNIERLRQSFGYVIQDGGLFPHLSARDNIALLASYLGWNKVRIDERIAELAALTRLNPEFMLRYPAQLSGGQRQRVGIMRALMLNPPVVLLDEPMGALDPLVRHELQADLKNIFHSLEKTVVLVTHDLGEAAYLGNSIALLGGGRIVQLGTYAELAKSPADAYVSRFLQSQRLPSVE